MAVRKETLSLFEVNFSIVEVVDNTNRQNVIYSKKSEELTDFKNENFQSTIQQEEKPRIKSRNFLSDISYVGINKEDCYNENFIFDVYLLMTKNLNPFLLDRKLVDKKSTR